MNDKNTGNAGEQIIGVFIMDELASSNAQQLCKLDFIDALRLCTSSTQWPEFTSQNQPKH